ncbi:hypothetical protein COCNU_scaffold009484G000020 [Cocos nucifera]|nr:hypothetical protein [Cocos nucifera]
MRVMIQLQCEALVERFGVSPLIYGIMGDIWLRYVALSRVFDEKWVEKVITESEAAAVGSTNSRDDEPGKLWPFIMFLFHYVKESKIALLFQIDNLQEDAKFEFLDLKGKRLRDEVSSSESINSKKPREDSKSSLDEDIDRLMDTPMDSKLTSTYEFLRNDFGLQGKHPVCNTSSTSSKSYTLEKMKINMEENGFQYIPPRIHQRTDGCLHYKRKRVYGKLIYVAHADCYIILRACAKLSQVDVRVMHLSVLKFKRRLAWIEQQIESSLKSLSERMTTMT